MASTSPSFAWQTGRKPASEADVWFLVTNYGQADRPEDELDRRARDLAAIHRPDREAVHWRRRWGVLPWPELHQPLCVFCKRKWLCPPAAWAHARLSTLGSFRREHLCEERP
ncbi:hypothetical protein DFJ64_0139 [Thermasporomyces composti]|jgi:hypothetical protein|uniref:Uncharacterized protein n=1 Tax=Thermasporomyces composti TaxID=696763 RepID=A0A3D9V1W1_THECX|nr:hypothetical protein DFJ64_0139 [Thermasporomyces composti]